MLLSFRPLWSRLYYWGSRLYYRGLSLSYLFLRYFSLLYYRGSRLYRVIKRQYGRADDLHLSVGHRCE